MLRSCIRARAPFPERDFHLTCAIKCDYLRTSERARVRVRCIVQSSSRISRASPLYLPVPRLRSSFPFVPDLRFVFLSSSEERALPDPLHVLYRCDFIRPTCVASSYFCPVCARTLLCIHRFCVTRAPAGARGYGLLRSRILGLRWALIFFVISWRKHVILNGRV